MVRQTRWRQVEGVRNGGGLVDVDEVTDEMTDEVTRPATHDLSRWPIVDGIDCSPENVREWIRHAHRVEARLRDADAAVSELRSVGAGSLRASLADEVEARLAPLLDVSKYEGGYHCCGCSTLADVLDDAVRLIRGLPLERGDDD